MKMRMSRAVLASAAVVAATVTLTTTPALASSSAPATTPQFLVITAHGAARPTAVQPADDCAWYSPPGIGTLTYLGTIICGGVYADLPLVEFPNGTYEGFAIGTSHAVWTAWDNTSGAWATASLGGLGYSAPWIVTQNGWGLTLGVSSSSGGHYCDNREDSPSGGWTGWFKC
jgi:hypothetical protein